jgi:hypothetical protein
LIAALGVALLALAAYIVPLVARDLMATRDLLSVGLGNVSQGDLRVAQSHLEGASDRLRSLPGKILRIVPVLGQNLSAVEAVSTRGISALESGARLLDELGEFGDSSVRVGRADLAAIRSLSTRADAAVDSLQDLRRELRQQRSGWLIPALWSSLGSLERSMADALDRSDNVAALLSVAPDLLGAQERRTFLVLLMNNAESRGSGGILSALGTVSVRNGRLALGRFDYYADLRDRLSKLQRVSAPSDFRTRFGTYKADTTSLVDVTMSPDVPDVALVASRLYRTITGVSVDGAIIIDPHGIAALLPESARVRVSGYRIPSVDLPQFIYSEAYEAFESPVLRRRILLEAGKDVFASLSSLPSLRSLDAPALSSAVGGGHIRLVSFDSDEQSLLSRAEVSGDLTLDADDIVLVTTQNLGQDKLDYWARRLIEHDCTVVTDRPARCSTTVTIRNVAPEVLPAYVTQHKTRATLETLVEIYVPEGASVSELLVNGRQVENSQQSEDGLVAIGTFIRIHRGESVAVRLTYDLELTNAAYSLEVLSHPSAHTAQLQLAVSLPDGYEARGPFDGYSQGFHYEGPLDRAMKFEAELDSPSGIPALWQSLGS